MLTFVPSKPESYKKDLEKIAVNKEKLMAMYAAEMQKQKVAYQLPDDPYSGSVQAFNEMAALHAWIIEREEYGTNADAIVLASSGIRAIAEKYGTPYFVFSGIRTIQVNGDKTIYWFKVYNINTGELVQFNVNLDTYLAAIPNLSMSISNSIKELSKNSGK
jgi:hypothetical protein